MKMFIKVARKVLDFPSLGRMIKNKTKKGIYFKPLALMPDPQALIRERLEEGSWNWRPVFLVEFLRYQLDVKILNT